MWLKDCGWIKYENEAPLIDGLRTWTFAKTQDGFRLYAEDQLLVDYTYETGQFCSMSRLLIIIHFHFFTEHFPKNQRGKYA